MALAIEKLNKDFKVVSQ
jgi:hypothetical protein